MAKVGRDTREWRLLRQNCYNRDKAKRAPCWICGQPINYGVAPSTTPDSWEPDHRFPVAHHPELAELPDNVMPSHKRCNRSRGNKAGINELGNQSRNWDW